MTYKNIKGEVKEISSLKPNFANVLNELNKRAINAGYQLSVEIYKDIPADKRYTWQSKGLMFMLILAKDGQRTTAEHWSINAPAFKRGSLSGKPIRIEIPDPNEQSEWNHIIDYI